MQIVMVYDWSVEWAASGTETLPIEYDSVEQAVVDFEKRVRDAYELYFSPCISRRSLSPSFEFAGYTLNCKNFVFQNGGELRLYLPEFLTVEEWFKTRGASARVPQE